MSEQQMAVEAIKITKDILADIEKLIKTLMNIVRDENFRNNQDAAEIYKHIKKGNKVKSMTIPDENAKILNKHLKEFDIPYIMTDVEGDNCKVIMFRNVDEEQVQIAIKAMNIELGNNVELSYDEFVQIYNKDSVSILNVPDKYEAELIKDKMIEYNIPHSAVKKNDGYEFMISKDNNEKMSEIISEISWNKTGKNAPYYNALNKEKFLIYDFVSKDRAEMEKILKKYNNEVYIVDHKNPDNYIKITNKNIEVYKNNKYVSQHSLDYIPNALDMIDNPVILTEPQMKQKEKALEQKIPEYDSKLAAMEEEYRRLYYEQIALYYAIHEKNKEIANEISNPDRNMLDRLIEKNDDIKERMTQINKDLQNEITQHMESAKKIAVNYTYTEDTKEIDRVIKEAERKVVENIKEETTITRTKTTQYEK